MHVFATIEPVPSLAEGKAVYAKFAAPVSNGRVE